MGRHLAFLVVEDDGVLRRHLSRLLGRHGTVDAVATVREASSALEAGRTYDAVLLDVQLPDGLGTTLLERVRAHNKAVSILVMTGAAPRDLLAKAHEHGAHYLLKPIDARQLRVVVDEARGRIQARERRTSTVLERWASDFDLSAAEAELLQLGAEGVPRAEFSTRRGVRPDTIRKQIQRLLRKTGDDTFEAAVNGVLREAVSEPT
jgi:DNA-binding response OmpR family regulator